MLDVFMWIAIGMLIVAGGIGAVLMFLHTTGRSASINAAFAHGAVALMGLGLAATVAIAAWRAGFGIGPWPLISITLMSGAGAVGVMLFLNHVKGRRMSAPMMAAHGLAAAVGVALLVVFVRQHSPIGQPAPAPPLQPEASSSRRPPLSGSPAHGVSSPRSERDETGSWRMRGDAPSSAGLV